MILCSRGHIYDNARFSACPYCNGGVVRGAAQQISYNKSKNDTFTAESAKASDFEADAKTEPAEKTMPASAEPEKEQRAPVAGWLVCSEGEHRGEDFRICGERSSIGSLAANDISLPFDSLIAGQGEAYINYDEKSGRFFIVEGQGKNNLRVNGEIVLGHTQIRDFDTVELGETMFIFRSFCGEAFSW